MQETGNYSSVTLCMDSNNPVYHSMMTEIESIQITGLPNWCSWLPKRFDHS